jgi:hypothetical protein
VILLLLLDGLYCLQLHYVQCFCAAVRIQISLTFVFVKSSACLKFRISLKKKKNQGFDKDEGCFSAVSRLKYKIYAITDTFKSQD